MRPLRAGLGCALIALVAGCGGRDAPSNADVVRSWVDAVREQRYEAADALFALPATLDNGTRVRATAREQVDAFNRSLPCGAILERTVPAGFGRVVATFRLVSGPSGFCDGEAHVSFAIRDGRITEWIRAESLPGTTQT